MSLKDRRRCAKFYFDHFYQIWRRGEPSEEVGLDGLKIGKLPPLSPLSRNHEKNIIVVSNFVRSIFRSFQKEILSLFEFHFQWREMGTNIQTYLPTSVRTYLIVTSKFGCYVWGKAWSRWPYVGYSIDQPNATNISTSCPLSHIKILSFYYNK